MGFLELSTSNGIANATANVSLALKDPNSTSTRLTMRALGTAITARPLDLLVGKAPTLSGSAAIDLRNIAVNGLPGISPAPGAHVSLGIADLRAPTNVTADVVGFDNLFDFNNINATDVLSALTALCDYLGSLKDSPFISAKVPFTSKTLADVVDFKKAIAEGLLDALKDPEGKPVARTAQALADKLSQVLGLPAGTINARFDAATKLLTFHVLLQKAVGPIQAPVQVSGNLGDVAVLNADTTLSLDGGVSLDFVFGADISRRTVTITATADAPVNGRITADAHFKLKVGADAPVDVTVRGAATTANNTVDDLVSDITDALATAGLAGTVAAGRNGNKLTFVFSRKAIGNPSSFYFWHVKSDFYGPESTCPMGPCEDNAPNGSTAVKQPL